MYSFNHVSQPTSDEYLYFPGSVPIVGSYIFTDHEIFSRISWPHSTLAEAKLGNPWGTGRKKAGSLSSSPVLDLSMSLRFRASWSSSLGLLFLSLLTRSLDDHLQWLWGHPPEHQDICYLHQHLWVLQAPQTQLIILPTILTRLFSSVMAPLSTQSSSQQPGLTLHS